LNPLLKWDGYWIFSDLTGIENLRKNSNTVINYFKNRILNHKVDKPDILNSINGVTKILFYFYLVCSSLFILIFSCFILIILPKIIISVKNEIIRLYNFKIDGFVLEDFATFFKMIIAIAVQLILINYLFKIIYKFIRYKLLINKK